MLTATSTDTIDNLQFAPGHTGEFSPRFPANVPVCVRYEGRDRRRSAVDVSDEGMFVESPDHIPIGELVQVLVASGEGPAIRVLCTVDRVISPEEAAFCGGMPGMGLRFFMMDSALRRRWEGFLVGLERLAVPRPLDAEALEHRKEPLKLSRRRQDRKPAKFRVRLKSKERLQEFYTRNVSRGGMFIATEKLLAPGSSLRLQINHPVTGREFPIDAIVRWTNDGSDGEDRGVGVQLVGRDLTQEEAFLRFINEG